MENKTILEVYKKRRYNELLIEKRAKEDKVKDDYSDLVKQYNDALLELLKEDNRENVYEDYKIKYSPASEKASRELEVIEKDFKDAMDDRNRLIEEVTAQLDLCTSREEHLEVFKLYGIVDEDGKIYDYK